MYKKSKKINTISHEINLKKVRVITKKEFGSYLKISNKRSIANHYRNYLFAIGKPDYVPLTNFDIYRLDGVFID